jgi:hypothetical protein
MDSTEKALGRIEAIVETIKEDVKDLKDLVDVQNGRVRLLEVENARSQGGWKVAGLVGAIAGTIGSIGSRFFSG